MSEQKSLTLDEARAEIRKIVDDALGERYLEDRVVGGSGPQMILDILARIEQSSEEDMAVLWLIREKGYVILRDRNEWAKQRHPGTALFDEFNPPKEARKLGWKP